MNGLTILNGLHNSRCGNHDRLAYFLSENILIKHYGLVGTAELQYATEIHELYSRITLQGLPLDQEVWYNRYCNYRIHLTWPKMLKMIKSLCVYQWRFWRHIELHGHKKTAPSRIIQTIRHCIAVHKLDLLLLIVKCPLNKIKILWHATTAPERAFHWYI